MQSTEVRGFWSFTSPTAVWRIVDRREVFILYREEEETDFFAEPETAADMASHLDAPVPTDLARWTYILK
jgi:hypothetical protein